MTICHCVVTFGRKETRPSSLEPPKMEDKPILSLNQFQALFWASSQEVPPYNPNTLGFRSWEKKLYIPTQPMKCVHVNVF